MKQHSARRYRWTRLLVLVTTLSVAAISCGDNKQSSGSATTAAGTGGSVASTTTAPKRGGSVTMNQGLESRGFDPVLLGGFASGDAPAAGAIFDFLMRWDEKANKVVPQLAESLQTTDSLTWTMHLRTGVTFTDGTPFNAAAVIFNIKRLQEPANAGSFGAGGASLIKSMDSPDPLTVVFTLNTALPTFDVNFTNRLAFIGSPTAITASGKDFATKPVGAGPFTLKEWVRDDHLTLVRNPNYWNAPRPYLDSVTIKPVTDIQQNRNSLDAGEAQASYVVDGETIDYFKAKNWQYATVALNGGQGLMFNVRRAPFNDLNARLGIAYAIKDDDYNKIVYNGHARSGRTVFVPESAFFSNANQPPGYNADLAKKAFDDYKTKNGAPLSFTYNAFQTTSSQAIGQFLQSVLKPYGVDVKIKVGDTNANVTDVFGANYDTVNWGINLASEPEPQLSNFFLTASKGNLMGFTDPVADAGLKQATATADLAARKDGYAKLQTAFNQQVPFLLLNLPKEGIVASPKLGGVRLSSGGILMFDEMTIN
jgi:peptide/nickel transport system substrate-binding protein